MDSRESSRYSAPLAHRVAEDANPREIADAVVATWSDIAHGLEPVVGPRGMAALFWRTLHGIAVRYPWLGPLKAAHSDALDLVELSTRLAAQPAGVAREAGDALFTTFRELLISLIGAQLSARLLQPVWSPSAGAPPARDASP